MGQQAVWKPEVGAMGGMNMIMILSSLPEYAQGMEDLMHVAYGTTRANPDDVFTAAMFRHHIKTFPGGQFIALDGDRVVGLTASMRIDYDPAKPLLEPWWQLVGEGWLRHQPAGEWLYGVESVVHPSYRSKGIGSQLMDARFRTAQKLNLRGMIAGSSIVSYHTVPESVTPEAYLQGVIEERYFDVNLSKQIKKGFRPGALIPNYLEDAECRGWGVTIIWDHPEYDSERPIG